MRSNLPVTQRERELPDGVTLMSTTDSRSHITYCNAAFLQVSGFERTELMGAPHNVVRHPDMPTEAFADMWRTLQAGQSWTALVKNRRKDGDHYWVRANATPMRREGRTVGYMSVRTKPEREEIAAAEALYRAFREGKAGSRRFDRGLVVRTGWMAWSSALQRLPLGARLQAPVAASALGAVAAGAALGLQGGALLGFGGVVAGLGVAAGAWLHAQVAAPLRQVLRQATAVAAGQPAANVNLDRVDEIGLLMRAVNQAGLNLSALVDDVGEQVSGLRTASSEIAQGNGDLSVRTEQAAASLQETAASMEEMTATLTQNAEGARQATEIAGAASESAARGGSVVGDVVGTMQQIRASSHRIADIIGVIDGIAFQTNILALNAAVEAARAGEQGRGFAVVAGEVRTLARRSADAAREIKTLIGDSVEKVEAGSRLADEAGRSMADLVSQVRRVSDLIGEISAATSEQTSGLGQVCTAVSQLDQVTQQNAALVEESAAAAESMKGQALRLAEAVGVYRRPA